VKNRLTRLECQPLPSRSAQGFSEREFVWLHRRRRSSGFGSDRYVSVTVLGNFGLAIAKGIAFKNFHSASHSKSFGYEPKALSSLEAGVLSAATNNEAAARKPKPATTFLSQCLLTLDTFPGRSSPSTTSAGAIYNSHHKHSVESRMLYLNSVIS
jgi:hypothetical protein